jgi:hypothetical protein
MADMIQQHNPQDIYAANNARINNAGELLQEKICGIREKD